MGTGLARPEDRHQPLAEEKKNGIRKKNNPRIVIPEGQGHPTNQPTGLARPEDRHQPLAEEKKPGIRKKKKTENRNSRGPGPSNQPTDGPGPPRRQTPAPGRGKKTRNSKEKKTRESSFQRARAIQPTNRRAWRAQKTDTMAE